MVECPNLRENLEINNHIHQSNCYFALKIMKKSEVVRLKQVEHIQNEKEILTAVNHPFIVTLCAPPPARQPRLRTCVEVENGATRTAIARAVALVAGVGAMILRGLQHSRPGRPE